MAQIIDLDTLSKSILLSVASYSSEFPSERIAHSSRRKQNEKRKATLKIALLFCTKLLAVVSSYFHALLLNSTFKRFLIKLFAPKFWGTRKNCRPTELASDFTFRLWIAFGAVISDSSWQLFREIVEGGPRIWVVPNLWAKTNAWELNLRTLFLAGRTGRPILQTRFSGASQRGHSWEVSRIKHSERNGEWPAKIRSENNEKEEWERARRRSNSPVCEWGSRSCIY